MSLTPAAFFLGLAILAPPLDLPDRQSTKAPRRPDQPELLLDAGEDLTENPALDVVQRLPRHQVDAESIPDAGAELDAMAPGVSKEGALVALHVLALPSRPHEPE